MLDSIAQTLDQVGSLTFWTCVSLLVATDVTAGLIVVRTRSRELVNRWTGRILAANLALLGAGVGVPLLTATTKTIMIAVAPMLTTATTQAGAAVSQPK